MEKELHVNKKVPIGIKIIIAVLVFPVIFAFILASLTASMVNMPDEKKVEMIQLERYKKLNINSLEEFDSHMQGVVRKIINPVSVVCGVVVFILSFGLVKFKKWAFVGIRGYLIFLIVFDLLDFSQQGARIIFRIVLCGIMLYYLNRSEIKQFYLG